MTISMEGTLTTRAGHAGAPPAWAPPLFLVAVTLLAYANGLDGSFHFDDVGIILRNGPIHALANMWPPRGPRWLGDLTFALNIRVGGHAVRGFHVVNVAIHLANALLVLALARAVLRTPALRGASAGPLLRAWLPLLAATLFALHPLATQSVSYVVQRFTALATLFFLLSLLLHLRARLAQEEGRADVRTAAAFVLSLLAAAAAMKSKEIAVTLPVVALGLELVLFPGSPRRRLLHLLPLAAAAVLAPLGHLGPIGHLEAGGTPSLARSFAETESIPRIAYLATQARVVVAYLGLLLLPVGQHLDWDVALSRSLLEPRVLACGALLAALAALAAWRFVVARRSGRAAGVLLFAGTAWFFATLSVESSVLPIADVMVEHRTYLPSVGFALVAATLLLSALERLPGAPAARGWAWALLLALALPLGLATRARNEVWRDDLSLWGESAARSPGKARPHDSYGAALMEAGRLDEAIEQFKQALRIRLDYPEAILNLGNANRRLGREEEALRLYREAIALAPGFPEAHNNLATIYEARGLVVEAAREYREALRLRPGYPEASANLARLLARHPVLEGGHP
jgi:tetratricopeptide (TPR) repeat protein